MFSVYTDLNIVGNFFLSTNNFRYNLKASAFKTIQEPPQEHTWSTEPWTGSFRRNYNGAYMTAEHWLALPAVQRGH